MNRKKKLFRLGKVVATLVVAEMLYREKVLLDELLARHVTGDWGDINDEGRRLNEKAIMAGSCICSAYVLPGGDMVWVTTEPDRDRTTVILPPRY